MSFFRGACRFFTLFLVSMTLAVSAFADPLPKASRALFVVYGKIAHSNSERGVEIDRKILESIGLKTLKTATPFTKSVDTYRGVLMRDLLAYVGAGNLTVQVRALDNYTIEIPGEDFKKFDVLLAVERNGKAMRVRDKGPAWIVYPLDQHKELNNTLYNDRYVWQIKSIEVK